MTRSLHWQFARKRSILSKFRTPRVGPVGAIFATLLVLGSDWGCTNKVSCPAHRRMLVGSSCNGTDLQCEYEVPIYNCDGTIATVQSSCTCSDGKWACPRPVEPECAVELPTESAGGADNSSGGTGSDPNATGQGGNPYYQSNATATAAKSRTRPSARAASCPLIFVWDGSKFFYETDVGGLTVSLPASATANRAIPVPGASTFYHLLPHAKFDSTDGIEIRLRESVKEIAYLDEARLILVDHPEGSEVWSSGDESTNEWGYQNPFKIYTGKAPRAPLLAVDRLGRDVLKELKAADNISGPVVDGTFENDYTLDFGAIGSPRNAKLIIEGWSIYRFRAESDVQPYVEAEQPDGTWVHVAKFGAPYGDFKPIVVELGERLPANARRLRLHLGQEAGARWVIDRVRLDDSAPVEVRLTELDPEVATLLHRGRSTLNRATLHSRQDALDDEGPDELIQQGFGAFTKFGDVRPLVKAGDDMYVIMRHGDQITFKFGGAPESAAGYVRTLVLKVDVVMKTFFFDQNVEPLPFHQMTAYPYPSTEKYPTDNEHQSYRALYNTRVYTAPTNGGATP